MFHKILDALFDTQFTCIIISCIPPPPNACNSWLLNSCNAVMWQSYIYVGIWNFTKRESLLICIDAIKLWKCCSKLGRIRTRWQCSISSYKCSIAEWPGGNMLHKSFKIHIMFCLDGFKFNEFEHSNVTNIYDCPWHRLLGSVVQNNT